MSVDLKPWPEKKYIPKWVDLVGDYEARKGWNACHDAFMKVIEAQNKPCQLRWRSSSDWKILFCALCGLEHHDSRPKCAPCKGTGQLKHSTNPKLIGSIECPHCNGTGIDDNKQLCQDSQLQLIPLDKNKILSSVVSIMPRPIEIVNKIIEDYKFPPQPEEVTVEDIIWTMKEYFSKRMDVDALSFNVEINYTDLKGIAQAIHERIKGVEK